ncbi:MAG: hypothetical protein KDC43_28020, partial [Saprospiraceae bacterium]|nr:hypothetical protein [Saprospiraceae bacterium]
RAFSLPLQLQLLVEWLPVQLLACSPPASPVGGNDVAFYENPGSMDRKGFEFSLKFCKLSEFCHPAFRASSCWFFVFPTRFAAIAFGSLI